MFHIPEFDGSIVHWAVVIYLCSGPFLFIGEATGWTSFGYSKFADRKARFALPSRLGMLIIYAPAVFSFWLAPLLRGAELNTYVLLSGAMVSAHFAKRCTEVLLLHRYSGVMNLFTTVQICFLYTTLALLLGEISVTGFADFPGGAPEISPLMLVGVGLWALGTFGNFHHHRLLANLREEGETDYKLPRGGLFGLVVCPHYTTELVGWFGFALFFHHIGALMMISVMGCYLAGRSHNTLKWYRDNLGEQLPNNWKRLVPFVF